MQATLVILGALPDLGGPKRGLRSPVAIFAASRPSFRQQIRPFFTPEGHFHLGNQGYRVGHSSTTMPRSLSCWRAASTLRRTLGRSLELASGDSATAITRP